MIYEPKAQSLIAKQYVHDERFLENFQRTAFAINIIDSNNIYMPPIDDYLINAMCAHSSVTEQNHYYVAIGASDKYRFHYCDFSGPHILDTAIDLETIMGKDFVMAKELYSLKRCSGLVHFYFNDTFYYSRLLRPRTGHMH